MPKTCRTVMATLAMTSLFILHISSGEAGSVCDASNASNARMLPAASDRIENGGLASATLCKQAPVGHRQPRVEDIPASQVPPIEIEMRREDEIIKKKLIICRHC